MPATIVLDPFVHDLPALAAGVSVGGFGCVLGSLANLIALRLAKVPNGLREFHRLSIPFLLVCGASALLLRLVTGPHAREKIRRLPMDTPDSTSLGLSLRRYGASRGSHSHDHFQVLIGIDGVLDLEVEGRGRRVGAGEGWVVTPGDRHDFESKDGSHCLILDTAQDLWAQCAGRAPLAPQLLALARYLALCVSAPRPRPPPCTMHRHCCSKPGGRSCRMAAVARSTGRVCRTGRAAAGIARSASRISQPSLA